MRELEARRGVLGEFELNVAFRFGDEHLKQRVTLAFDAEQNTSQTTVSPFGAFLGKEHLDNTGLVGAYDATLDNAGAFSGNFW